MKKLSKQEQEVILKQAKKKFEKIYGKNCKMTEIFPSPELRIPGDRFLSPITKILYIFDGKENDWVVLEGP